MGLRAAAAMLLTIGFAVPALAGQIYSWRTDDGDVAFSDEIKNVPPRYRDQVKVRQTQKLADYGRYSAQNAEGTERYREQLAERLQYLRAVNARDDGPAVQPEAAAGSATLRLSGTDQTISVDGDADAPVIIERVRVRRVGQIATRHDTVVRQGDKTLAIMRGSQSMESEAPLNVVDEDDLEFYR
jgi:hypothetical protein